jgi:hypothetical protein
MLVVAKRRHLTPAVGCQKWSNEVDIFSHFVDILTVGNLDVDNVTLYLYIRFSAACATHQSLFMLSFYVPFSCTTHLVMHVCSALQGHMSLLNVRSF